MFGIGQNTFSAKNSVIATTRVIQILTAKSRPLKQHFCKPVLLLQILFWSGQLTAQVPSANFTASPVSGCSPLVVNFQDLSTGAPTSWSWDFGNGSTSTLQNPTTTYFTPGSYTVRLTATNASGSNTLTRTGYITVFEPPSVNFAAGDTTGCFPFRVQFTDLSTAGAGNTNVQWDWNFGDGATSSLQNPLHTYNASGNYTVTLKVTNDKGCSKTFTKAQYIQVTTGVTADFTNTAPSVCRPPVNISFTNNTTGPGILSYSWNFGDGNTSVLPNPVHTYNAPGSYTVTLVASSSAGCSDSMIKANVIVIDTITTSFTAPDSVCLGSTVNFINTSSPAPLSSFWDFGDGTTSTLTSPSKVFSAAGSFVVRLTNTYNHCQDSSTKTVHVISPPVADFTAPVLFRCQPPLTVNFQDLSTGGAVSWLWNFGDGNTSVLQNPVHTYTAYGNFTVTLITTNSTGCRDTIVKNQYVRIQRPVITLTGLPVQGCTPFTMNFSAGVSTLDFVTSYLWNFGDGNTSTLSAPSYTYTLQGSYTVSLTITTSTGCTETLTLTNAVKVGTSPTVDFTASTNTACVDEPIQFTDLSIPADNWLWDFGNGATSTQKDPIYAYPSPGTYTVKLIARNSGCPDSLTKTDYITVRPPQSFFTYTVNCNTRTDFVFTDRSDSAITWLWDFGDGTTSTLQNPAHTFPGVGVYTVSLTVTYGSCSHTYSETIRVIDESPDISANTTVICKRQPVTFSAIGINTSNISSYYWDFGDGTNFNGGVNSTHTYNTSGNYTVTLITTDLNGCRDTVSKTNFIRINGPLANFNGTNISGCNGLTATFNDLSATDGINNIVSWRWDFGDGTIQTFTAPPFQHTYSSVGSFNVKLLVTDAAGCVDSIIRTGYVNTSDPTVTFSSPDTVSCPGATIRFSVNATGNGIGYLWDFGDGNSSTLAIPPHAYSATGQYTVKLRITDQYGCSDSLVRNLYIRVGLPAADFTMSDSASSCSPFEVTFTNTSSFYYAQWWDFGDGNTSTLQNPTHYYTNPGVYTARLVVESGGSCRDTITKTVTLYDTVGTRINYSPFNGCKPHNVNFNVVNNGPVTYIWDFGDGQTLVSNSPVISHVYDLYGDFVPKVILEDPTGCLIPVTGFDTIRVTGASANFGVSRPLLCDSGFVSFIDSTTSNDPVINYNWDFGDGATSGLQNPSHFYSSPGIYNVSLIVRTQAGCADTIRIDSILKIVESPLIQITGDSSACIQTPLNITGTFLRTDTSAVSWSWNLGNGNSSTLQNPPPQTYASSGNILVSAIAVNSSGCTDTATRNIRIHPLPTVILPPELTINVGAAITIPATYSGNMSSYIWSPPNNLSCTTCPNPDASPVLNTRYSVLFADSNGCQSTGSILIKVLCQNSNIFMPNTFSPNSDGRNDVFYPRGVGVANVKTLRIFNRWGEVIFEKHDFPANDPSSGWDGTYKGKAANNDVYIYQLEIYCQNGELIRFDGNVALIR